MKVFFKIIAGVLLIGVCLQSCTIHKSKNIKYNEALASRNNSIPVQTLNIFSPKNGENHKVILFAYGGSWKSGKKELYSFLGKRLARRGYVAVIIDYPLAPKNQIQAMSLSVAQAINWSYEHITEYGGDKNRLFVSGHSAGGHLISLNTVKDYYFEQLEVKNPIKGAILIDAAGLDMYNYLKGEKLAPGTSYLQAFTNDPVVWKEHSPIYYLDQDDPKLLILMGGKTYPGIASSTKSLLKKADSLNIEPTFHLQPKKKHIPMITQFFWPWSKAYSWIDAFTENIANPKQ